MMYSILNGCFHLNVTILGTQKTYDMEIKKIKKTWKYFEVVGPFNNYSLKFETSKLISEENDFVKLFFVCVIDPLSKPYLRGIWFVWKTDICRHILITCAKELCFTPCLSVCLSVWLLARCVKLSGTGF